MADPDFPSDVFLSHSAKDKAVVRPLAERSREDGMRRNSQPSTFNSQPPPGSDWAQLEPGTLRTGQRPFRDPLNKERRFLPLRLDDAPIKGSLAQFLYINWLSSRYATKARSATTLATTRCPSRIPSSTSPPSRTAG